MLARRLEPDCGSLLPYCPTALLPYCPTALLPYCPTALLIFLPPFIRFAPHIYSSDFILPPAEELMATLQNFDAEIEKTREVVEEMRSKIAQSGTVLDTLAKSDQKIGDTDFDIENARIEDVIRQQKVMESNIADLIIGLEDATNAFGTEFEGMKGYTGWETFVGVFSEESKQRMR